MWHYIFWGIVVSGIVLIMIFLVRSMNKKTKELSGGLIYDNDNNNDEINHNNTLLTNFDLDQDMVGGQELPGLGDSQKVYRTRDEIVGSNLAEAILKTRLRCAFDIIPDVEFGEDDSDEMVMLKQAVLKVKGILGKIQLFNEKK